MANSNPFIYVHIAGFSKILLRLSALLVRFRHLTPFEQQVGAVFPAYHAEIVETQRFVDPHKNLPHFLPRLVKHSVVHLDGVKVQRKEDAHLCADLPLRGINRFMDCHQVAIRTHFSMCACNEFAGTVAVHHNVVDADNPIVRKDFVRKLCNRFRVGRFAHQRADGIPQNRNAGIQHKPRYDHADIAVDVHTLEIADDAGKQDGTGADDIGYTVARGSAHGGRFDTAADICGEPAHPKLNEDGRYKHSNHRHTEFYRFRRNDLLDRFASKLKPHD